MDDAALDLLQQAALDYAAIRDQRQKLTARETELKQTLLTLMREQKRITYSFDGVDVERVVEQETVKVRVRKLAEEETDEA
ncbi:MAG TPA: hypothetical protein VIY07_16810, partial [Pseudolabrys sp.]